MIDRWCCRWQLPRQEREVQRPGAWDGGDARVELLWDCADVRLASDPRPVLSTAGRDRTGQRQVLELLPAELHQQVPADHSVRENGYDHITTSDAVAGHYRRH